MWGDFVGSSLLTDEDFKRLASELESGLIAFDQARAARLEAEIGQYLDAARYGSYETFCKIVLDEKTLKCLTSCTTRWAKAISTHVMDAQNLLRLFMRMKR